MTPEEKEEIEHFRSVLGAIRNYKRDSERRIQKSQLDFRKIQLRHQEMLIKHGFLENLQKLETCVAINHSILDQIIADAANLFDNAARSQDDPGDKPSEVPTKLMDIEKVQTTLKQFVRDWSVDGVEERRTCYLPILRELESLFPVGQRGDKKVLLPGAGLGRLAYEVAKLGYQSQGNEFSLFMLFASNFVLNKCKFKNAFTIYPWIHQFTNNLHNQDITRSVQFPDVDPSLPEDSNFSMIAGDFLEVYADQSYVNYHDVVVTCFFLDCAHNVLDFIELIHKILKPGGKWINLGPLLYHFADVPKESSIEPSYDIVRNLILDSGFQFVKEVKDHEAVYCQNPKSMLQYHYKCVNFTCVKI